AWPGCPGSTGRTATAGGGARRIRRVLALAPAARQPAARERAPRDDAHVVPPAGRQDVGLDAADEHRVRRLLADESLAAAVAGDPLGLDDLRRGERRRADVADLALADEVGERAERLVDVGRRVLGAVDLVEVDPVGVQALQRRLDLADDPAAGVAELVGVVAHRPVDLGGEDDVVAPPSGQRLCDDRLGLAARVDVSGIDEVDARVERAVDDADAVVVVLVAPVAEHHRAEAERAHGNAGAPESAVVHRPDTRGQEGSPRWQRTPGAAPWRAWTRSSASGRSRSTSRTARRTRRDASRSSGRSGASTSCSGGRSRTRRRPTGWR